MKPTSRPGRSLPRLPARGGGGSGRRARPSRTSSPLASSSVRVDDPHPVALRPSPVRPRRAGCRRFEVQPQVLGGPPRPGRRCSWISPSAISIARWQYSSTAAMSWVTRTIVLPAAFISWKASAHFCWKAASPTASTSSISRMSASTSQHQREGEPHQHPGGVVLQLQVGEVLEFGELDHRVQPVAALLRGQAHHHAVEDDVFTRGQLLVEADAELDEGGEPAGHLDPAGVGAVDAGEQLQQRALAGAVAADDAEELALADLEGDPVEGAQLAVVARGERVDGALFQRVDPLGRDAEGLVQVFDPDRGRRVGGGGVRAKVSELVFDGRCRLACWPWRPSRAATDASVLVRSVRHAHPCVRLPGVSGEPQVAVVIPTWNSAALLPRLLDSLAPADGADRAARGRQRVRGRDLDLLRERGIPHVTLRHNTGFAAAVDLGVARTAAPLCCR